MDFFKLPPKNMVLLASVIGIALAEDLTVDQQNIFGNFLMTVGQNIVTYAMQPQPNEKDTKAADTSDTTGDTSKKTQDSSNAVGDTSKGKDAHSKGADTKKR